MPGRGHRLEINPHAAGQIQELRPVVTVGAGNPADGTLEGTVERSDPARTADLVPRLDTGTGACRLRHHAGRRAGTRQWSWKRQPGQEWLAGSFELFVRR